MTDLVVQGKITTATLAFIQAELACHPELDSSSGLRNLTITIHYSPRSGLPEAILFEPSYRTEVPGRLRTSAPAI